MAIQEAIKPVTPRLWSSAKTDPDIRKRVADLRKQIEARVRQEGEKLGIADLTLQSVFTISDRRVAWFYKHDGGKDGRGSWIRVREGDAQPAWIRNMGDRAKQVRWPNGASLTDEAKAKFKGKDKAAAVTGLFD